MNKVFITSIAAAAGLVASGFASATPAQTKHWYAGGGINHYAGQAERIDNNQKLANSGIGFNAFVGNQLTDIMSVEGGFNYFGHRRYDTTSNQRNFSSLSSTNTTYSKFENTYHVYLDGLARLPLGYGFNVFAKAGVGYFNGIIKDSDNSTDTDKLRTFAINYGGGLQFDWQQYGVRLSYTGFKFSDHARFSIGSTQGVQYGEPAFLGLDVLYHFA